MKSHAPREDKTHLKQQKAKEEVHQEIQKIFQVKTQKPHTGFTFSTFNTFKYIDTVTPVISYIVQTTNSTITEIR